LYHKMENRKIIMIEIIFVLLVVLTIFALYPRINYSVSGDVVRFTSINSNVLIFSKNEDFSNSRYVNFENDKAFVKLEPGKYYFKSANNYIKGFKNEIEMDSEVGIVVNRGEDEGVEIENIGNVKINITKTKDGLTIGYIQLSPTESEEIEDKGVYTGREVDG